MRVSKRNYHHQSTAVYSQCKTDTHTEIWTVSSSELNYSIRILKRDEYIRMHKNFATLVTCLFLISKTQGFFVGPSILDPQNGMNTDRFLSFFFFHSVCSSNHIFAPKCHEPIPSVKMLLRTTMVEIWIVLVRTWYARVPCESNLPLCFYQTIRRVPYKFPQIVLHATQRNSPTLMLQLNLELCKNTFTRKQICYSRGYLQFWSDCLVRFFWSDFMHV
jgi:hypothetical protein